MEVGLLLWMFLIFQHDIHRDDREHAFFALTSALAFLYGCVAIVGLRPLIEDIALGMSSPVVEASRRFMGMDRRRRTVHFAYSAAGVAMICAIAVYGATMVGWA